MHSFSLNLVAERMKVPWDDLDNRLDEVETQMLSDFYAFVRDNSEALWVHWKMSNIYYGFQAISHRYNVLSGESAVTIPDTNRFNLASLIEDRYGVGCVDHPIMYNLIKLNIGTSKGILSGEEEVEAFERRDYKRLHNSTMSKVYSFRDLLEMTLSGKLRVQRRLLKQQVSDFMERPEVKLLGFVAVLFALVQLGMLISQILDTGLTAN